MKISNSLFFNQRENIFVTQLKENEGEGEINQEHTRMMHSRNKILNDSRVYGFFISN
jgi:hypothetical protein